MQVHCEVVRLLLLLLLLRNAWGGLCVKGEVVVKLRMGLVVGGVFNLHGGRLKGEQIEMIGRDGK